MPLVLLFPTQVETPRWGVFFIAGRLLYRRASSLSQGVFFIAGRLLYPQTPRRGFSTAPQQWNDRRVPAGMPWV
jgi:hypothetical protein